MLNSILSDTQSDVHSFTLQFAGCGRHALPIVLSKQFVTENAQNSYGDTAKVLIHEWAHYRYGVFNEFGFPADPLYPLYYSIPGKPSDIYVTSCADGVHDINFELKTQNEIHCELSTNNQTGMPDDGLCIPLPDITNNTFKSSFMYQQAVRTVDSFCGSNGHKHNVNAPNKQNVLCNGRDTWNVIESHPDLLTLVL